MDLNVVVSAKNLSLTFKTKDEPVEALKDVNLEITKGEFVSFIGPSGCGKTTFLRVIADLEKPTCGEITINNMPPEQARRERAYGYVFQAAGLYPWRTIRNNIRLPLEIMGYSDNLADANQFYKELHMLFSRIKPALKKKLVLLHNAP